MQTDIPWRGYSPVPGTDHNAPPLDASPVGEGKVQALRKGTLNVMQGILINLRRCVGVIMEILSGQLYYEASIEWLIIIDKINTGMDIMFLYWFLSFPLEYNKKKSG